MTIQNNRMLITPMLTLLKRAFSQF